MKSLIKKFRILIIVFLSMVSAGMAVLLYTNTRPGKEDIRFLTREEISQIRGLHEQDLESEQIFVDVEGQVKKPGVIKVPLGKSVLEVIELAGGFTDKADISYIHKNMNLAEEVKDRQKIYIPVLGEKEAGKDSGSDGAVSIININDASKEELDALPGIGPSTAQKIIESRPFSKVEDIKNVSGIGDSLFEKIKSLITI